MEYEGKIHHSLASLSNYRFFVSMEEGFYNVNAQFKVLLSAQVCMLTVIQM